MDTRAGDSGAVEPRLREVLAAALAELDAPLADLLQPVAGAAAELLRCRYAAISVVGPGGSAELFVTSGLSDEARDQIEVPPTHRGLLGVVAHGGEVVRIADVAADPRALAGDLPSEHLELGGLLGVPIVLRGRPGGGLFLSSPADRDEFGPEDEGNAALVAGVIATVIERSRTAATNRRRDRWTSGASSLSRELVSGTHRPFRLIANRVLDIADADLVAVLRPYAEGSDRFVVAAAAGPDSVVWKHALLSREALGLAAADDPRAVHVDGLSRRLGEIDPEFGRRLQTTPVDSALLVPLTGAAGGRGVLGLGRRPGRTPFSPAEAGMATMFAGQVALALDLAESLAHRDQLALIEERDRIARDLHDHVIQRLFAIGLTMQYIGTDPQADAEVSMERVRDSVEEIDDTIKQIRTTIYRLRGPIVSPDASLRTQTTRLLDDLESVLGFRPDLSIDGPIDFGVDEDLIDDCIAVLREALTNVARHAEANRADVAIIVTPTVITLQVVDDGRGLGPSTRRSGLANLRARAEQRGGTLTIDAGPTGGTQVCWIAPMGAGSGGTDLLG